MKFSFDTTIVEPISGKKPKNIIILFHGYGGDGKNISFLTLNNFLIFLCMKGQEACILNIFVMSNLQRIMYFLITDKQLNH